MQMPIVDAFLQSSMDILQQLPLLDGTTKQTFKDFIVQLHKIELLSDQKSAISSFGSEFLSKSSNNQRETDTRFANERILRYCQLIQANQDPINIPQKIFDHEWRSLFSLIRYNPLRLAGDDNLLQLVVYLIICFLECFHRRGIPHLDLTVNKVYLHNHEYRVILAPPDIGKLQKVAQSQSPDPSPQKSGYIAPETSFADVLRGWILKKVSNYDYLMCINRLAGRELGNSKASAILPWITDFSSPEGNLRDLSKTKFRLTKGEHQLDATYSDGRCPYRQSTPGMSKSAATSTTLVDGNICGGGEHRLELFVPHHLLDMMPNLAYYTYMARRTPVELLKRYVRRVYRPEEFPTSLQRLYASTPEECIPEFFTDPAIFTSIHADMPDLQLPEWFSGDGPAGFLAHHRALLESDEVSAHLHEWIDITFGYKLLGEEAVAAKNVHLELVSSKPPPNSRVTCLFSQPHPRRALDIDDLITVYEEASSFIVATCGSEPLEFEGATDPDKKPKEDVFKRDIDDLACLIVELCVGCRVVGVIPDLANDLHREARLERAHRLFRRHISAIPSGLRNGLGAILTSNCTVFPISLLRRCLLHFPPCVVDFQRAMVGLRGCVEAEQLHFEDGPPPSVLLDVFLGVDGCAGWTPNCFPQSLLTPLTSCLERYIDQSRAAMDALFSGKLVQFYLAVGGKQAVELHLMPLVMSLFRKSGTGSPSPHLSRLYSRRFIRSLLLATRLPVFLTVVPPLTSGVLSSNTTNKLEVADDSETLPNDGTPVDDSKLSQNEKGAFPVLRNFLEVFESTSTPPDSQHVAANAVPTVAASLDSIYWLASTFGPLATNDYLIPPLLKALADSYQGTEKLSPILAHATPALAPTKLNYRIPKSPLPMPVYTSGKILHGDREATGALRCLERLAALYGVQVILSVYLPCVKEAVANAVSTLRADGKLGSTETRSGSGGVGDVATSNNTATSWDVACEARLIASMVFLQQFVTYLPAYYLMDCLQEPIISWCLTGALMVCGRVDRCFPSGQCGRLALLYKTIDCIYVLGIRLGFELTRRQMTELVQLLFSLFDRALPPGLSGAFDHLVEGSAPPKTSSVSPVRFFTHGDEEEEEAEGVDCEQQVENRPASVPRFSQASQPPTLFVIKLDRHTSSVTVAKEEVVAATSPSPPSPYPSTATLDESSPSLDRSGTIPPPQPPPPPHVRRQRPAVLAEVRATFNAELAYMAYISLCRLAGGSHIEESLYNIDLVRKLVAEHEATTSTTDSGGDNCREVPSKAPINSEYEARLVARTTATNLTQSTHLRAEWEDFFSAKVQEPHNSQGSSCSVPRFQGKRLATFAGHNGSVKCIVPLTNESSFITVGSDKTVQLYSITAARQRPANASATNPAASTAFLAAQRRSSTSENQNLFSASSSLFSTSPSQGTGSHTVGGGGDGSNVPCPASLVFTKHRRTTFSAAYLHLERLVASTDGSLIIWDPVTGQSVSTFGVTSDTDSSQPMTSLLRCASGSACSLPSALTSLSPSVAFRSTLLAGDDAGCLLVIDPRVGGQSSVARRFYAAIGQSLDVCPALERSTVRLGDCRLENISVKQPLIAPGALRSVVPLDDSGDISSGWIICGFSSGLMSVVDVRSGCVVATWRGHMDTVSQIFSHGSGVFSSVSSGDKSVAFWSLDAGGESLTGCRTGPPAPMTGISCATPLAAPFSLLFGGSAFSTSAAVDTPPSLASSSSAKCILSFCNLHQDACVTAAPSSGVVVGTLALGGGHLSAMATLPHTLRDSLLTGTSAGSLCLFY